MAEIVSQGNRLGQILVESERTGQRSGDARDLDRVGHPRPVMIAGPV